MSPSLSRAFTRTCIVSTLFFTPHLLSDDTCDETLTRSCDVQRYIKCLVVDNLVVRNSALLPNAGSSSGSGSCAPCSSQDLPNTLALRDSTGSFALNTISIDGNAIFTQSTNQSPSGQIIMENTPVFWVYPNGGNLSLLSGGAGSLTGAIYTNDIVIGQGSLAGTTYNGANNVIVGKSAAPVFNDGSGNNVIIGSQAAHTLSGLNNSVAIGRLALGNGTGSAMSGMVAIGFHAGLNLTQGPNVCIGGQALSNAINGAINNTAIGTQAMALHTTGNGNVVIGYNAASNTVSGGSRVIIGEGAAVRCTGDGTVVIGSGAYNSGLSSPSGDNNIIIGTAAGTNYTTNESNNILIGDQGQTGDQSVCRIDNIYTATVSAGTGTAVFVDVNNQLGVAVSSRRFKTNIADLPSNAPDLITQLRPVQFNYLTKDGAAQDALSHGLIAEEVALVDESLVIFDSNGHPRSVKYHELDAYYIAALQYVMTAYRQLQQEHQDLYHAYQHMQQDIARLQARAI